jgi:hypothetical protein
MTEERRAEIVRLAEAWASMAEAYGYGEPGAERRMKEAKAAFIAALTDALTARESYVLVPVEPTIEMIYAGATVGIDKHGAEIAEPTPLQVDAAWRAMLDAARPTPASGEGK